MRRVGPLLGARAVDGHETGPGARPPGPPSPPRPPWRPGARPGRGGRRRRAPRPCPCPARPRHFPGCLSTCLSTPLLSVSLLRVCCLLPACLSSLPTSSPPSPTSREPGEHGPDRGATGGTPVPPDGDPAPRVEKVREVQELHLWLHLLRVHAQLFDLDVLPPSATSRTWGWAEEPRKEHGVCLPCRRGNRGTDRLPPLSGPVETTTPRRVSARGRPLKDPRFPPSLPRRRQGGSHRP